MRVAVTDPNDGTVLNIIEASSLERAREFYPSCRLATATDTIAAPTMSAEERERVAFEAEQATRAELEFRAWQAAGYNYRAFASSQAAISKTAVVALAPTAAATTATVVWIDLAPLKGSTTNAAGYVAGTKTIGLAAAGTGALYAGDVIAFAGQADEYPLASGDSDVSGGGSIVLAGPGLHAAIAATATAITLVRRGAQLRVALNCDNDTEGLIASQSDVHCDVPAGERRLYLGGEAMLYSDVPITMLHASANISLPAGSHRIEVTFGVF